MRFSVFWLRKRERKRVGVERQMQRQSAVFHTSSRDAADDSANQGEVSKRRNEKADGRKEHKHAEKHYEKADHAQHPRQKRVLSLQKYTSPPAERARARGREIIVTYSFTLLRKRNMKDTTPYVFALKHFRRAHRAVDDREHFHAIRALVRPQRALLNLGNDAGSERITKCGTERMSRKRSKKE